MHFHISKMASKKRHTSTIDKYLGPSAPLPLADLPTLRDILKQCQLLRERQIGPTEKYSVTDMASDVLPLIFTVWNRANAKLIELPIRVSDRALTLRIESKWTTLSKIARKKGNVGPKEKQSFESDLDKLFSILSCSCDFITCGAANCQQENCPSVHLNCDCARESKIPKLDLPYIKDQREKKGTKGHMQMALGDAEETGRQLKATKRKEVEVKRHEEKEAKKKREEEELHERMAQELEETIEEEMKEQENSILNEEERTEMEVDATFQNERIERQIRSKTHSQNRTPLPRVAQSAIRYDVSRRAAAAISTSTLMDYGIITSDNLSQIVSFTKIDREIARCMEEMEKLRKELDTKISGVFFDGRNDRTKVMLEDDNGKKYPSTQSEEHVTLTSEPGGDYLGHVTPAGKDAKSIANELLTFFVEGSVDKTLEYFGGDSTPVNTGKDGGVMRNVEEMLGHRLMRVICELHTNELGLRHIIEELDGPTSGANSFSGRR